MGIKNFHTYLHNKFPLCKVPVKGNNIYEFIYIDLNFILHNSIYGCKTEKDFTNRLFMNLDIIFSNFIATKEIYFAIDGPSSFAKILLQRKRRQVHINKINPKVINSLCITPGTDTMSRIESEILKYIKELEKKYKYNNVSIKTSFSDLPNEGEIKICKRVIDNYKEYNNNLMFRHLIIGNDSDLIVLAMGMQPVYKINILIKGKDCNELISLEKLLICHSKYICQEDKIENLGKIRDDFMVLSIMMGNDYLPKVAYTNYDKLWKNYKEFINKFGKSLLDLDYMGKFILMVYNSLNNGYKKNNIKFHSNYEQGLKWIEGILWCIDMYKTGVCSKYDYIYEFNSPHPYELLFCLSVKENRSKIVLKSDFLPIPKNIYPLIVMPKAAEYLLNKKQQKLMNSELKYLYEKEECTECQKQLLELNESRNEFLEYNNDNNKNKFKTIESKYKDHLKTHKNFTINDIHKIILVAKYII